MKPIICAALCAGMLAAAPVMAVTNLVQNGSFEAGLANWTIGGTDTGNRPPVAIFYNSATPYPTGAYSEAAPNDNSTSLSPDAVGDRAAYFVTDFANAQSLSQRIFLERGKYTFGFSAYAPRNGFNNVGDARFQATILGASVANYLVSSGPATTWQAFVGEAIVTAAGFYSVDFRFDTNRAPSKDVVIDRVFVAQVPEPTSWAMLITGFGLVGAAARRRGRTVATA